MRTQVFGSFGQMIRWYWQTEKRLYLRLFLTAFGLYVAQEVLSTALGELGGQAAQEALLRLFNDELIFWGMILYCLAHMFSALERKQTATTLLSLPAGNAEKFLSRVVYANVGIWLLVFLGRCAANALTAMPLLFNPETSFGEIVRRHILPGTWILASIFETHNVGDVLVYTFGSLMIALWPMSLFTLCGVLFRRYGWLWALFIFIAATFILIYLLELNEHNAAWINAHHTQFVWMTCAVVVVLSTANYALAYRSFCRAQIISDKMIRL